MRRSIASLLTAKVRSGQTITVNVLFQGKQKPTELTVSEVLDDALLVGGTIYPFATMTQLEVVAA